MEAWEKMVDMAKEAYIQVYGMEKWDSLTNKQKHDVLMFIANDLYSRIK